MELRWGSWERGSAVRGRLLFVTGFLVAPRAYASLLAPVADAGFQVVVPKLRSRCPRVVTGSVSARAEAERALAVARGLATDGTPLWIGGHSRGGLVAWIAAADLMPAGLVLVDPVSGGGPPWARTEPPPPRPQGGHIRRRLCDRRTVCTRGAKPRGLRARGTGGVPTSSSPTAGMPTCSTASIGGSVPSRAVTARTPSGRAR